MTVAYLIYPKCVPSRGQVSGTSLLMYARYLLQPRTTVGRSSPVVTIYNRAANEDVLFARFCCSQAAFASILLSCVARATYLCYNHLLDTPFEQQRNREVIKTQTQGAAFIVGTFRLPRQAG